MKFLISTIVVSHARFKFVHCAVFIAVLSMFTMHVAIITRLPTNARGISSTSLLEYSDNSALRRAYSFSNSSLSCKTMSYAELFPVEDVPSEKSVFGANVPCFSEVSILYSVEAPPSLFLFLHVLSSTVLELSI